MTTVQTARTHKMKECVLCTGPIWAGEPSERIAGAFGHQICVAEVMEEAHDAHVEMEIR